MSWETILGILATLLFILTIIIIILVVIKQRAEKEEDFERWMDFVKNEHHNKSQEE